MKTTATKNEVEAVIAAVADDEYLSVIQIITGSIEDDRLAAITAMPGVLVIEERQVFTLRRTSFLNHLNYDVQ